MFGQFGNDLTGVLEALQIRCFVFFTLLMKELFALGYLVMLERFRKRSDVQDRGMSAAKEVDEVRRGEKVTSIVTFLHGRLVVLSFLLVSIFF
jgi:hypothetical protein